MPLKFPTLKGTTERTRGETFNETWESERTPAPTPKTYIDYKKYLAIGWSGIIVFLVSLIISAIVYYVDVHGKVKNNIQEIAKMRLSIEKHIEKFTDIRVEVNTLKETCCNKSQ